MGSCRTGLQLNHRKTGYLSKLGDDVVTYQTTIQGRRGATATNYGLLLGLIGIVATTAITSVGGSIQSLFGDIASVIGTSAFANPTEADCNDVPAPAGCTAPVNTSAPGISGGLTVGSQLTASQGDWDAFPAPTYRFQWQRDGVNIPGATQATYQLVTADTGADMTVAVTATNSLGSTTETSSNFGPVVDEVLAFDWESTVGEATTGQTATPVGGASRSTSTANRGSGSLRIGAENQYLSIPSSSDFDLGNGDFTLDLAFRFDGSISNYAGGVSQGGSSFSWQLDFIPGQGNSTNIQPRFAWTDESGSRFSSGGYSLCGAAAFDLCGAEVATNQWHIVRVQRTGSILSLSVNGGSTVTKSINETFRQPSAPLWIGEPQCSGSLPCHNHGTAFNLDDLRLTTP